REFVLQDFGRLQLRVARHVGNRTEIQAIVQDFMGDVAREHAMHPNLDARMLLAEFCNRGHERMNRAFIYTEGKLAPLQAFEFTKPLFDFIAKIDQAFGIVLQKSPGIGEANRPRPTYKKPLAQIFLKLANRQADRGLRTIKAFRSARKTAFACDRKKD